MATKTKENIFGVSAHFLLKNQRFLGRFFRIASISGGFPGFSRFLALVATLVLFNVNYLSLYIARKDIKDREYIPINLLISDLRIFLK